MQPQGATFRALRRRLSAEQLLTSSEQIAEQLILLKKFRESIVEAARIKMLELCEGDPPKESKLYFKSCERFTTWFFDNLACGTVKFCNNKFSIEPGFTTGYAQNFLSPEEVQAKISKLLDQESPRISRVYSEDSESPSDSPQSSNSPVESKFENKRSSLKGFYDQDLISTDPTLRIVKRSGFIHIYHAKIHVKCPTEVYQISKEKYVGAENLFHLYLFALLGIYSILGLDNNHMSIPPAAVRLCEHELFGSPINTIRSYFSPFYEIEKFFGSRGSYFTHDLPEEYSIFSYNPPFSERIMELAAKRLVQQLEQRTKTNNPATVIVTLPVWDSATQKELNLLDRKLPFAGWEILEHSGFLREHEVWKRQVEFFDHVNKIMTPIIPIHIAILSTLAKPPITLDQVADNWHR